MTESYLTYHPDGTASSFVGPDAVSMYRAALIATSLKLWVKTGIIPTRGFGITKMLAEATRITGKKYTRKTATQASADVTLFVQEMKAALPVFEN